ncbi:MAG: hypothetical protein K2O71_03195 [Lachnospiraceae bacterium]|jgi:hypothetical protein|nr:hypothetical protein [Lachnospiraceae bacterium]
MKYRKNLYSIILILVMLVSTFRQDNGCSTLSEEDPPPNKSEVIIEE